MCLVLLASVSYLPLLFSVPPPASPYLHLPPSPVSINSLFSLMSEKKNGATHTKHYVPLQVYALCVHVAVGCGPIVLACVVHCSSANSGALYSLVTSAIGCVPLFTVPSITI